MGRKTLVFLIVCGAAAAALLAIFWRPSPKVVVAFTGYRPSAVMEYSYAEFNLTNLSRARVDTYTTVFEDQNGVRTNGSFLFKDFIRANPSKGLQSQAILSVLDLAAHGPYLNKMTLLYLAPGDVACCRIPTNELTGVRRISITYVSRQTNLVDVTENVLINLLGKIGVKKNKRVKVEAAWCDVPNSKPIGVTVTTNSLSK